MKELTKEQLAKEIKEHKQKMQLNFVNDLLDRMEHLAIKAIKPGYEPSHEELIKISTIKDYANEVFKTLAIKDYVNEVLKK